MGPILAGVKSLDIAQNMLFAARGGGVDAKTRNKLGRRGGKGILRGGGDSVEERENVSAVEGGIFRSEAVDVPAMCGAGARGEVGECPEGENHTGPRPG